MELLGALGVDRRLRALTVVDAVTREALAIEVDQGIKGEQVVEAMTRITLSRGGTQDHPGRQRPMSRSSGLDRSRS
jgi:putative transposase